MNRRYPGRAEHSWGIPGPKLMLGNKSAIPSAATSIPAPGTRRSARDKTEGVEMSRRGRAGVGRGRCGYIGELARRDREESNLGYILVVIRGKGSRDEAQRRGVKPFDESSSFRVLGVVWCPPRPCFVACAGKTGGKGTRKLSHGVCCPLRLSRPPPVSHPPFPSMTVFCRFPNTGVDPSIAGFLTFWGH